MSRMRIISVQLPQGLINAMDQLVKQGDYPNRSEIISEAIRERMRREGYEFEVSKPKVITKEENGKVYEPIEEVVMDIPETYSGAIIEALGKRKGVMKDMVPLEGGRVKLVFEVPTRGLIGFNQE
uniref:ribbon-helix-helix domain-containing protein n=1 Tax=Thermococcus sp. TaxID=35749 RepID=UPI00345A9DC7